MLRKARGLNKGVKGGGEPSQNQGGEGKGAPPQNSNQASGKNPQNQFKGGVKNRGSRGSRRGVGE
eukprot:3027372-Lingulodinium_polyedra.AAC.1